MLKIAPAPSTRTAGYWLGAPILNVRWARVGRVFLGAAGIAAASCPAFASDVEGASEGGLSPTVAAALIAMVGVVVSTIASLVVAQMTAVRVARSERDKRQAELALKISESIATADDGARKEAMRRFAVGMLKVREPAGHDQQGKVFFVPMNSRITMGREDDNDIVLKDKKNSLSRWHAGFIADQKIVWIDDFASVNGTTVQDERIEKTRELRHGDRIVVGPFVLEFRLVRENTVLSQ